MPELVEQMYCSQQIVIPPKYPYILKRYCKAAIKTQPYDLLRWSFEYFKALSEHRPPPVKLRLEYPVFSTEGGLTRGCLKVLAKQLLGMKEIPLGDVKAAWQGFCLDPAELKRIFCLCQVHQRADSVPFLHFVAVSGGLLTKSLTNTMILLCETLTEEPDGGSAAIPVGDFMEMYKFLAKLDASRNVNYINGFMEGDEPPPEEEEEQVETVPSISGDTELSSDDFWDDQEDLQKLLVIDDMVARTARLSVKLNMPVLGKIERSPSVERAGMIERDNYLRERKGRAVQCEEVEKKLQELSASKIGPIQEQPKEELPKTDAKKKDATGGVEILVYDEDENLIPYDFYGEPPSDTEEDKMEEYEETEERNDVPEEKTPAAEPVESAEMKQISQTFLSKIQEEREERLEDLERTFDEIQSIVDRFKSANYDLGMVAGRQMSTTSGEFIVQHIEKEIMDYINEQIAILPDPDLKKKKAKPEEVEMIREILEMFLDENMDIIAPETEEVEEEEQAIPEMTLVYAVPGIGPRVEEEIVRTFQEYAAEACKLQGDVFMPRNIRHFLCPPLEKYEDNTNYEDTQSKKEEVPTGGIITD